LSDLRSAIGQWTNQIIVLQLKENMFKNIKEKMGAEYFPFLFFFFFPPETSAKICP
jgi:hypothetical protein